MSTFLTLVQKTVNPWASNSTDQFLFYINALIASIIELWIIILWGPISAQLYIYMCFIYSITYKCGLLYQSHSFTCSVLMILNGLYIFVMNSVVPLGIWKYYFWWTHAFGSVHRCVGIEWLGPEAVRSILRRLALLSGHSGVHFHRHVSPHSSTYTSQLYFCDWEGPEPSEWQWDKIWEKSTCLCLYLDVY